MTLACLASVASRDPKVLAFVETDVRATRGNVFDLVVATRRRELGYKITVATRTGFLVEELHLALVTPDASPRAWCARSARDAGGASIARAASADQPAEIALAAGEPSRPQVRGTAAGT